MYYGADYYPEHWPKARWDTDARLMAQAKISLVRMAEFAWALLEPQEGLYDFGWLDDAIELLGQYGISTLLGTPTATPPAWLCQRYPEMMRVGRDGRRATFGMRRQYCATSETYRRLSQRIVRAMAEHYADNPHVIGWQLDNEFGCHDSTRCYCTSCQSAFQEWAERRYGSLDALNEAWGTTFWSHIYTSRDQIPLPWDTTGVSNPCLELDFWRFASEQMVSYQQVQIDILRSLCPSHVITTNFMSFGFQDINYYDLALPLDFVSWDNYPLHHGQAPSVPALSHAVMRGLKDIPFWVMEQQAGPSGWQTMSRSPKPGQLRLWVYQAIGHGADAIVYFRWRSCRFNTEEYWHGIIDHDGEPRRRYAEIQGIGQELRRLGDRLAGATTPKAVAMLLSYDDAFAFRLQPNAEGLVYKELFSSYYKAFHTLGVPVDVVSPEANLNPYQLVIAPTLHVLPEAWVSQLKQYVEQGGHLVIGARSGVKDMSNRLVEMPLPGLLGKLCGVEVVDYDPLGHAANGAIRFEESVPDLAGVRHAVHTWCDIIKPMGAEVIARYAEDYYVGEPAITRHRYGQGSAVYVGTMGSEDLCAALATWLMSQAGLRPLLTAPSGVEVVARDNQGVTYLFVLNHADAERTVELPYPCVDLITGKPFRGETALPPYKVMILIASNAV